jgi:dTDP-4-amino-4,6-dideoxygalactose transaminase
MRPGRPPGGERVSARAIAAAWRARGAGAALAAALRARLGVEHVELTTSGREALRITLARLAARRGRSEVVLPAYTCWSVAASAVAAGLRVRLVDVDERGRIDLAALATLPLERAAAVVACNLFGVLEPLAPLRAVAQPAGCALIDDAAQGLGLADDDGPAGARGDAGILSFGRGKPVGALGGGALVSRAARTLDSDPPEPALPARDAPSGRVAAALRALAWDAALSPRVFALLARLPFLHIGETAFDPGFARGSMDPGAQRLALALLPELDAQARARAAHATALVEAVRAETRFEVLGPAPGSAAPYPRLVLRAPSPAVRDRARAALLPRGATGLYPSALDAIEALAPHLAGPARCAGARSLAERVLTLPLAATHSAAETSAIVVALRTAEG